MRAKLSESEERARRTKMIARLSLLFAILDFAVLGIIIFEVMQLLN